MPEAASPLYVDGSGDVRPVEPGALAGAAALGWVPASDKQAKDFALEQIGRAHV